MICLRDFKNGADEKVRKTLCGKPCSTCPTANSNISWWRQFGICPMCWDAWLGAIATLTTMERR